MRSEQVEVAASGNVIPDAVWKWVARKKHQAIDRSPLAISNEGHLTADLEAERFHGVAPCSEEPAWQAGFG